MYNAAVIIAAAGSSTRMGGGTPKQYRQIDGVPMLIKTVGAFSDFCRVIIAADNTDRVKEILQDAPSGPQYSVVRGGDSRQESVANALALVREPLVLVHDGARPFVSKALIGRVMEALKTGPAVIPGVTPKSTIRTQTETLDRNSLIEVQTPQGFKTELLKEAYAKAKEDGYVGTDDAGLVERLGIPIVIADGEYSNIKVTTPEDLPMEIRCGSGYDVHRFIEGRPLMCGCTRVPYEKGLLGHSDADVLSHAIADALLGAAALGDIGIHWPDNSPDTEGMAGRTILEGTAKMVREAGYRIVNIDATVIAEKPKLAPYEEAMRKACAEALGIEISQISIKATTEEGLGIRSSEGMAATAVANIRG